MKKYLMKEKIKSDSFKTKIKPIIGKSLKDEDF